MYEVTNPLDVINDLAYASLYEAYSFIITENCYNPTAIPSLEMIHNHFVDHFIQGLFLDTVQRDNYESLGAEDFYDFEKKIKSRKYHPFIPDIIQLRIMLNTRNITYMIGDVVHNPVVKGVW